MVNGFSILLFLLISIPISYGHGGEDHEESKIENNIQVDQDGFEIISSAPSKIILEKINKNYLKNVKKIFLNKCLSCHGVIVSLPWYYHIPGPKQLIDYDMKEAKKHMDMSNDFPFGGHGNPIDDLNALKKSIKNDSMPPLKYKLMHWNSKLSEDEIITINVWIKNSKQLLK